MSYLHCYSTIRGYDAWKTAYPPEWEVDNDLPTDRQDPPLTDDDRESLDMLERHPACMAAWFAEDDPLFIAAVTLPNHHTIELHVALSYADAWEFCECYSYIGTQMDSTEPQLPAGIPIVTLVSMRIQAQTGKHGRAMHPRAVY